MKRWIDFIRRPFRSSANAAVPYSLHRYTNAAGEFDYAEYRSAQIAANKRKLDLVWARESNIRFLAEFIASHIPTPRFGLCHGTRRGLEQTWFRDALGCEVLGTEISDTAAQFPFTIQWDFHDVKEEWLGAVDFIYSNSLDHSYDPAKCLNAWLSCLTEHGILIIEHSQDHAVARESDPFGAALWSMPYLVLSWTNGRFCVREILSAPEQATYRTKRYEVRFLIIRRNAQPHRIRLPDPSLGGAA